jgi:eukaryotic-like serine/threonine-protein kinase
LDNILLRKWAEPRPDLRKISESDKLSGIVHQTLGVGEKIGPYEILAPLGAGGMGEVWKARDTRLHRTVAIKRMLANHSARFEQEARAIAAFNHPHICQIYDVGPDYLVMEYVEGTPVKGPIPPERNSSISV